MADKTAKVTLKKKVSCVVYPIGSSHRDDLELLILLLPPPECWDHRHSPPCLFYTMLRIKPKALCSKYYSVCKFYLDIFCPQFSKGFLLLEKRHNYNPDPQSFYHALTLACFILSLATKHHLDDQSHLL